MTAPDPLSRMSAIDAFEVSVPGKKIVIDVRLTRRLKERNLII